MKIDTDWFLKQIEVSQYESLRRFSLAFGIDHGNMSRMLNGLRPMRMREAEKISKLLGLDLSEVLAHAGLKVQDPQILIEALEYYATRPGGHRALVALTKWRK